ncbi:hypothetical protein CL630_01350 [bacterium]|nr:hypothetical protein [bacterium]
MSYFSTFEGIVQSVGLCVERNGGDGEATFLIPSSFPKKWTLPVDTFEVRHDGEKIRQGVAEIWIRLLASYYGRDAFLTHSVEFQKSLNRRLGYEYEGDFDGASRVVLFKEVPLNELLQELKKFLALVQKYGV